MDTLIGKIVQNHLLSKADESFTFKRIPHGLTNQSWLVKTQKGFFVLRIASSKSDSLKISRHNELIILETVASAEIGAHIVFSSLPSAGVESQVDNILITKYIEGKVWTLEDAQQPDNIQKIANLLKKLHQLPYPSEVLVTNYSDVLEYYCKILDITPDINILNLSNTLFKTRNPALCHHDINHFNIIDNTEKVWLLDWEYSGVGDPYFDLASLVSYHQYSESQKNQLLEGYFGQITASVEKRFEETLIVFRVIEKLWISVNEL